jgi:7,8-didemethyl-8-hydroxy-5-deazariboflavin synthase CofG subunit
VSSRSLPDAAPAVLGQDAASILRRGGAISVDDAEVLLGVRGAELDALLDAASAVRDAGLAAAGRPGILTYSRKVFVPLTTLCRDRCHYCVFVDTPGQLLAKHKPTYMSPEQVLSVVRQGQALGCKEALLTLGDRPEDRWPEARDWLDAHGYASTLDYVGAIAELITRETGMLAHLNPGVMSLDELRTLRPTAPSMGMMLETTSERLYAEPGQVHFGSPDKDPAVRLGVIEDAGRAGVPFTTGILVGIGETLRDRAESLFAIRDAHARHGHVQEVIVQNFRAKPRTAMRDAADPELDEYIAAVAVARLVLGPLMRVQVPPNLSDPEEFALLVRAGADDWGGVSPLTADHVNPERPWPHLDDLAARTAELGFALRERLTAQPEFVRGAARWIDPALHAPVAALADPATGLARDVHPVAPAIPATSTSTSDPAHNSCSTDDPATTIPSFRDSDGREPTDRRSSAGGVRLTGSGMRRLAERAAADPLALDDAEWALLLRATGGDLDALTATADDVRRYTVGEAVSIVVNRNLTSTGLRSEPAGPGEFSLADAAAIAADAWELGATEVCVQGMLPAAEDPAGYAAIVRALKGAAPRLHVHGYRPQDVWDLADRDGRGLEGALDALVASGVDTMPGTGVKVLSERVRALVAPGDVGIDRWVAAIGAAHRRGIRTSSVLFYGHAETAVERVAHLRTLRRLQDEATAAGARGGFSEFVPIPLPGPAGGVPLVAGRAPLDEHRAMVAVSRLALSGSIPHVQIPWTRVGREAAAVLLGAGGDDLGGTLLDGRVRPDAGIEHGAELPIAEAARLTRGLFRPLRQRTTDYREPAADRKAAWR